MKISGLLGGSLLVVGAALLGGAADGEAVSGAEGYLAGAPLDLIAVLPPAPAAGSARDKADRQIFRDTRRLEGTPRWDLAVGDVKLDPSSMLRAFSCAVGVRLTEETAPRTAQLLRRAQADVREAISVPKEHYKRKRPFLADKGAVCQSRDGLAKSFDYPSGHTSWGWAVALLLAEADAVNAPAILERGRAYGESRIVCGAHNASAVEAGRITAASVVAALHGNAEFRDDIAAARGELKALRRGGGAPDAAACVAEKTLLGEPLLSSY